MNLATCKYLYSKAMATIGFIKVLLEPEDANFLKQKHISYKKTVENNTTYYILDSNELRSLFCNY